LADTKVFPVQNKQLIKTTNISIDDIDDYSLSFDGDSDNNTQYSQDFDNDISAISMSRSSPAKLDRQGAPVPSRHQQQQGGAVQQPLATPLATPELPSLAVQSLEAEKEMDKLSKEIVFLRNQQRIALKDRRIEARGKKTRAEERRVQYQLDLAEALQKVTMLQLAKKSLEEKVDVLEVSLLGSKESKALVSGALEASKTVILEQQQVVADMQASMTSSELLATLKEAEWNKKQSDMVDKMEELRTSLVTAQLHVSVMAKSNEASEERWVT
jgi:hypothetical protein